MHKDVIVVGAGISGIAAGYNTLQLCGQRSPYRAERLVLGRSARLALACHTLPISVLLPSVFGSLMKVAGIPHSLVWLHLVWSSFSLVSQT